MVFTSFQIGLIIFLIFLLILTFASLRHRYSNWTMGGFTQGIVLGMLVTVIIGATLLVGGTHLFQELLRWKEAPVVVVTAMDTSRNTALKVLGASIEEKKVTTRATIGSIMEEYKRLTDDESESLRSLICTPIR